MQAADLLDVQAWLSPRKKRFWAVLIIACYTLAGFFLIPWLIKVNFNDLSQRFIMRDAEVKDIRFNPWTLRLQVNGFALHDTDKTELAGFDELLINFQVRSALQRAFVFREVSLTGPHIYLTRYKFADTNFGRMLADIEAAAPVDTETASPESGLPRLIIDKLVIATGTVDLRDEMAAAPFETRLGPIDISVQNISTLPDQSGEQQITVNTETGSTLSWTGSVQVSPLKSAGKIEMSGSPLPLVYRYLKDQLGFSLRDCCLDLSVDYAVESMPNGEFAVRVDNLSVSSRELEVLALENAESILQVPEIRVSGGKLEWPERVVSIAEILVDRPKLGVWIGEDGVLNLNTLLPPDASADIATPSAEAATAASVATSPAERATAANTNAAAPPAESTTAANAAAEPVATETAAGNEVAAAITVDGTAATTAVDSEDDWDLRIAALRIVGMQIGFTDRSLAKPGNLTIPQLDLTVSDISNRPGSKMPFSVAAQIGKAGKVDLQGAAVVLPAVALDTKVEIAAIAISDLQPWVEPVAQIFISDGLFNFSGTLASSADEMLAVKGDLDVLNLAVSDTREKVPLIGWQRLAMQQARLQLTGGRLDISRVTFDKPFARLIIAADGTTNFEGLGTGNTVDNAPATAAESATNTEGADTAEPEQQSADAAPVVAGSSDSPEAAALVVSIGKTVFKDGAMEFGDFSLPLPFQVPVREFGGSISTLATDSLAPSDIALEGKVGKYGYVKVAGALRAMAPTEMADINVTFRNISMPDLSPYTAKFAGRKIAAGKLDLDLNYIFDQRLMRGKNKIVLEKFQLGEKVESPGALDLPLDLAVSLLTDSNGVIDLELDVSGDLNDPAISAGALILKVFVNLITKAVTAPFKLLARLLPGGSDMELDTLNFAPGRADLLPPEREKLDQLASALAQRPQLALTIPGAYNRDLDTAALRVKALEAQLTDLTGETSDADEQEMLTGRTRKALEKLARKQLPELSLDDLRDQLQQPVPDSTRTTLDEVAYMAELRRQLEAIQPIEDSQLLALAGDRQSAVIAQLASAGNLPEGRITSGTVGVTDDAENGEIQMRLEVETGDSGPAQDTQPEGDPAKAAQPEAGN